MKKYNITVNGKTYEVEVEEIGQENPIQIQKQTAPVNNPVKNEQTAAAKETPAPKKAAPAGKATIEAPMPGTILSIKVKPGAKVSQGDVIMILEAMKMENEILSPQDGTIASVEVAEGASVNTADILATLE